MSITSTLKNREESPFIGACCHPVVTKAFELLFCHRDNKEHVRVPFCKPDMTTLFMVIVVIQPLISRFDFKRIVRYIMMYRIYRAKRRRDLEDRDHGVFKVDDKQM